MFSPPTLHPPLGIEDEHRGLVRAEAEALASRRPPAVAAALAAGAPIVIPLTTVSTAGNFDSEIEVQFPTPGGAALKAKLLVDSGNSMLVVPNGKELANVPGYKVLGAAKEPWGCPANVMQGPVQIVATDGSVYEMADCVFYACTAPNGKKELTANFGCGCISPWSANGWNTPLPGVTMQSPLSYNPAYRYAEFVFAPAAAMLGDADKVVVNDASTMVLRTAVPSDFTMMSIINDVQFMSLSPTSFVIGGTATGWPGSVASPIAVIDTGGGPVLLTDPNGYVYDKTWPDPVTCPAWTEGSIGCRCISERLQVGLKSAADPTSYTYTLDTSAMPAAVRGLTAVMCETNEFLRGQQGMNVGGITALFNRILIDYGGNRVGFAPKYPNSVQTVEMGSSVDQLVSASSSGVWLAYDFYPPGKVVTTAMTVSWNHLPAGTTFLLKYCNSPGADIVSWTGPTHSRNPSGDLRVTFTVKRTTGDAAVPVLICAVKGANQPVTFRLKAKTQEQ